VLCSDVISFWLVEVKKDGFVAIEVLDSFE
jgi:hypothetical protein